MTWWLWLIDAISVIILVRALLLKRWIGQEIEARGKRDIAAIKACKTAEELRALDPTSNVQKLDLSWWNWWKWIFQLTAWSRGALFPSEQN